MDFFFSVFKSDARNLGEDFKFLRMDCSVTGDAPLHIAGASDLDVVRMWRAKKVHPRIGCIMIDLATVCTIFPDLFFLLTFNDESVGPI